MSESFFTASLGQNVFRIAPCGRKTLFNIKNYETAQYLFGLQSYGYSYKKAPNIHSSELTCTSCEG